MKTDVLTTGGLAAAAGLNVETLRFYERSGLLAEPKRTAAGYRQYPRSAVARLRFIKRAQQLGFTLAAIRELLSLQAARRRSSARVKRLSERQLEVIDGRIRDLQRMRDALAILSTACDGHGPVSSCPIIHALEENSDES